MTFRRSIRGALCFVVATLAACQGSIGGEPSPASAARANAGARVPAAAAQIGSLDEGATPVTTLPGHEQLVEDTTPKDGPRLMPAETYIRSYMALFGGLAPLAIQGELSHDGLFDAWDNYLQVLGLPDYRQDLGRGTQVNALMIAAFDRLGIALCDRAVLHDLRGAGDPVVFTFDVPTTGPLGMAAFAPRFDALHRRFLGYPAAVAPTPDRVARFYALYEEAAANEAHPVVGDGGAPRFTPSEAGWAAVCYGLVRHPEFQLY